MAPERHEGEDMEVYRVRLQQQARHNKAIVRGYKLADPADSRTKEVRRASRDVTKTLGPRQAKKLRREMREAARAASQANPPPPLGTK